MIKFTGRDKNTLVRHAVNLLTDSGVEEPYQEARLLLEWAIGEDRLTVMHLQTVDDKSVVRYREAVERRCRREPFAFITGKQGFWTLNLSVSQETLIPRADSETLIDTLLKIKPDRNKVSSLLDLGTGTGCLLLASLTEYPKATGLGVDISEKAINLAVHNAQCNGLEKRARFLVGSWADEVNEAFDVILSNPPYIEHDVIAHLMPEVERYEPHRALDGGDDGLGAYRLICKDLPRLLASDGCAILELGAGQEDAVTQLAELNGLRKLTCDSDFGGVPRALVLIRA